MSTLAATLAALAKAGIAIRVEGDQLKAAPAPPPELVDQLRGAKPFILFVHQRHAEYLRRWVRSYGEERGSRMAFADAITTWHVQHGRRGELGHCAGCDKPIADDDTNAYRWHDGARLHGPNECAAAYGTRWRTEAAAALAAIGIATPDGWEP